MQGRWRIKYPQLTEMRLVQAYTVRYHTMAGCTHRREFLPTPRRGVSSGRRSLQNTHITVTSKVLIMDRRKHGLRKHSYVSPVHTNAMPCIPSRQPSPDNMSKSHRHFVSSSSSENISSTPWIVTAIRASCGAGEAAPRARIWAL